MFGEGLSTPSRSLTLAGLRRGCKTVLVLAADAHSFLPAPLTRSLVPHRPRHFRSASKVRTLARRAWEHADRLYTVRQQPSKATRPQCKSSAPISTRMHRPRPPHADRACLFPSNPLVRPQVRLTQPLSDIRLCRPRAGRLRREAVAGPAQPNSAGRQGQGRAGAPAGDEEGDEPGRDGAEAEACQE